MNEYKLMNELSEIIFPRFHELKDCQGNKYILLGEKNANNAEIISRKIDDRTAFESFENHYHLWDKISRFKQAEAKKLALKIVENLVRELKIHYPEKSFYVFLELNFKDSTIIRFHQKWPGEKPYYSVSDFPDIIRFEIG